MSRSPNASSPRGVTEHLRRSAPLNSVSSRIILCVFGSTLLTAFIVSWLSIGAIHRDVRARIEARSTALLDERGPQIEHWHDQATGRLTAAAVIGGPWHAELVEALDALGPKDDGAALRWQREPRASRSSADGVSDAPSDAATEIGSSLPPPPAELAAFFDEIRLHSHAQRLPSDDCPSTRIDLIRRDGSGAGKLEGCLSRAGLYGFLNTAEGDARGLRMLVADVSGRVLAAAGIRAERRRAARLPMASLHYPSAGLLADYRSPSGERLIGALTPLGRTGWSFVVEADHARAFAPARAITNQIVIVDVCIILLFSILAYKITRAIMQPIEALSQGAQRIAAGQVDYQIPMPRNDDDELGLLTRTFNGMMKKLRNNQLESEQDRYRLAEKNEELQRANEILAQLSITDGLTKLHNHRYFQDHLTREIKRVSRTQAPLSLILLDIDDFKLLNDTHGHAAGDEVLVSLAAIMNDSARESDLIARYGGEEFVILMPNTDLAGAVHLAEKIRMAVETTRLIIGDNMKPVDVTISLGVALYAGNRREFFAEADKALYRAKAAGKNCVIIAGSDSSHPD